MSAGCQSSNGKTRALHCCLTCSLQKSLPACCRECLAPWQPVLLLAVPLLGLGVCYQELNLQLCVQGHYQYQGPYLRPRMSCISIEQSDCTPAKAIVCVEQACASQTKHAEHILKATVSDNSRQSALLLQTCHVKFPVVTCASKAA